MASQKTSFFLAVALAFHYLCFTNIGGGSAMASQKTSFFSCRCTRLSLYLFHEYRMRLGSGKSKNFVFFLPLHSPFTIFADNNK